jgi:hypothetical protein
MAPKDHSRVRQKDPIASIVKEHLRYLSLDGGHFRCQRILRYCLHVSCKDLHGFSAEGSITHQPNVHGLLRIVIEVLTKPRNGERQGLILAQSLRKIVDPFNNAIVIRQDDILGDIWRKRRPAKGHLQVLFVGSCFFRVSEILASINVDQRPFDLILPLQFSEGLWGSVLNAESVPVNLYRPRLGVSNGIRAATALEISAL